MKHVCTAIAVLLLLAAPMLQAQAAPRSQENPQYGIQHRGPGGDRAWHGHGDDWNRGRGRHEERGRGWRDGRGHGRRDNEEWCGRGHHRVRVRFGLFGWRWVWVWGPSDWGDHHRGHGGHHHGHGRR
jgi:hypothetical protein